MKFFGPHRPERVLLRRNTLYVPFVVPGLSTSSSTSSSLTSPTLVPQEPIVPTQHPAWKRSENTRGIERVRGDPSRGPAEIQNPNKNEDNERVRGNPLRDLPEWLEKYTENLVDESVPEYRDAPAISFVSQLQSREEKLFRASTIYIYIYIYIKLPEGPKLRHLLLWKAIPICETFKISCLMGKLHTKGVSECFLTDQWYRLDQWSPYLCEGHIEITSIWSKNLARYIPRLCIVRGENLERKHWSQTLRNWKRWTHLKSMLKNPMQRKCQRVWVVKSSNSLIADGIVKLSGRDQVLRTSTLIRDSPDREEQGNLQEEPDGSSSVPFQDSSSDDGEARNDFRYITGNYIYRHHFEPRVKLYVPREALFPIPLKYIDVTRTTDTSLDFLARWWRSRMVRYVDRFHKILFIEWKNHQMGPHGRGETDKKTNDFEASHFVARDLERYDRCIQT